MDWDGVLNGRWERMLIKNFLVCEYLWDRRRYVVEVERNLIWFLYGVREIEGDTVEKDGEGVSFLMVF